ncbi:hypothetical protein BOTBODRAFT_402402 [Botryobasidium botryosum FD-172 SS1]|uniref:Uncharacterized protein n=1 Tax=Botryobasidium botryosum (strain FD-172 SS1) TaxID=930990 RepID=A0A067MBY5_BOTB1|nr:hypothetical protein BOTBODRAFT_402402 [Botryobasidium botryosum FD-172 SS1]
MAPRASPAPKSTPVCLFFGTPRGCFNGDSCRFLHTKVDDASAAAKPAELAIPIPCRYFAAGYCYRGDACRFKHGTANAASSSSAAPPASAPSPSEPASQVDDEEPNACAICFEDEPKQYGLLDGCSHAFCLSCIRDWRTSSKKEDSELVISGATKTCPVCRTNSHFITPSSVFYKSGDPRKDKTIDGYKARMSTIPCKYFAKSRAEKPFCPFGRDCFYQHLNADGTPYVFEEGVDKLMEEFKRRQSRAHQQRSARALMELNAGLDAIAESLLLEIPAVLQHLGEDDYFEDEVDDWEDEEDEEDFDDAWGELVSSSAHFTDLRWLRD